MKDFLKMNDWLLLSLLFMKHPFLKYHTCITFTIDDFLSFLADLGNGMFKVCFTSISTRCSPIKVSFYWLSEYDASRPLYLVKDFLKMNDWLLLNLLFIKLPFLKYHTYITFATNNFLSSLADLDNGMFRVCSTSIFIRCSPMRVSFYWLSKCDALRPLYPVKGFLKMNHWLLLSLPFMKLPFLKYHTCITFATNDFLRFSSLHH